MVFEGTTTPGARVFAGKWEADVTDDGAWQEVVLSIESEDEKLDDGEYREIYFNALHAVEAWDKIAEAALANDTKHRSIALVVAVWIGYS